MKRVIFSLSILLLLTSCDKSVFTGIPEVEETEYGVLNIKSNPSGAVIYVDGKNSGFNTPATFNWMNVGGHKIELRLNLYQNADISTDIYEGSTSYINYDFTKDYRNYGNINCYSNVANCDIYINDSLTNKKTNYCFENVKPGNYKIKFTRDQHRSDSTVVTVSASQTCNVEMNLVDTLKIVQYTSKNSTLPSNIVNAVAVDVTNRIWIGTALGLHYLSGGVWHTYNMKNSPLSTDNITKIFVDKQNRKWVGTSKGLFLFDNGSWTNYTADVQNSRVTDITADSTGNIWVGTYDGLCKLSNGTWQVYTTSNSGLAENFVTCLTVDNKNKIWIGSVYHYLSILNNESWSHFTKSDIGSFAYETVTALNTDFSGNIIVAFGDNWGSYDGYVWTNRATDLGFPEVQMSYKDSNYLIFGSKYYGAKIFRANGSRGGVGYLPDGSYLSWVQCACVDHNGNLWLGCFSKGLYKFKKGSF